MPVYLFIGPNTYLKEKALADLKSSLLKESSGLDYKLFRGGETDFREISESISTIPFLSSHRVVAVKNIEELDSEDLTRLTGYIRKIPKSTYLILDTDEEDTPLESGDLRRSLSIKRFGDLTDSEIRVWMRAFVRTISGGNKKIDDDAILELTELHGRNLFILSNELEKLAAYAGNRNEIALNDVLNVAGRSLNSSAFELTAAIEKNKVDEALRIISDLVITGKKHYEIIGLLCWHIKRLLRAKVLQSKGRSDMYLYLIHI